MEYNFELIDVKYALIKSFMIHASPDVLDISFNIRSKKVGIQLVLLEGALISANIKQRVFNNLPGYDVSIEEIYLTKEKFNLNRGEWEPKHYTWLNNVLFSKAEI